MSTSVEAPAPLHEDDAAPAPRRRRSLSHRLLALTWNKPLGLTLIALMAVASLLGTILPQMPDVYRESAATQEVWIDEAARPRFRGLTEPLRWLGMFHVFSSWGFLLLALLLAISIAGCTIHRFPRLWALAVHPHLWVRRSFFSHARLRAETRSEHDVETAAQHAVDAFSQAGYRVLRGEDRTQEPGVVALYADRNRFMPFGTALAHLAFILILAGFVITSTMGFRNDDLVAPIGMPREAGGGSGLTVEATSFTDSYDAKNRPTDYVSHLKVSRDGHLLKEADVRVNTPLTVDGMRFSQASFGVAVELTVTDASGKVLVHEGAPLLNDEQNGRVYARLKLNDGRFIIADAPSEASGTTIPQGGVLLALLPQDSNEPLLQKVLTPGASAQADGLTITFHRERPYTGLMVSRDPGAPVIWLASVLLMLGTTATMGFRHRRVWVRVEPDGDGSRTLLGCPDRPDALYERRFQHIAAQLRTADTEENHA